MRLLFVVCLVFLSVNHTYAMDKKGGRSSRSLSDSKNNARRLSVRWFNSGSSNKSSNHLFSWKNGSQAKHESVRSVQVVQHSDDPTKKELATILGILSENQEALEGRMGNIETQLLTATACAAERMDAAHKLEKKITDIHTKITDANTSLLEISSRIGLSTNEYSQKAEQFSKAVETLEEKNKKLVENIALLTTISNRLEGKTKQTIDCKGICTVVLVTFFMQYACYLSLIFSGYVFST